MAKTRSLWCDKFQVSFIHSCQDLPFLGHVDEWIHKLCPTWHHLFHRQDYVVCFLKTIQQFRLNLKRKIICGVTITQNKDMFGMYCYLIYNTFSYLQMLSLGIKWFQFSLQLLHCKQMVFTSTWWLTSELS